MLEVAAGTCICGRAVASFVSHVVCLDATKAMLEKGREECQSENLKNITLVKGFAEELPFLGNSFDIVLSRLAFHHIPAYKTAFKEMARFLSPNGKLVLIDMVPADENLRSEIDLIEKMRDPSHNLSLTKAGNAGAF